MRRVEIGSWPRCGIAAEHDVGRVNDQELRSPIPPPPLLVQCSLTRQSPIPPLIIIFFPNTHSPSGRAVVVLREGRHFYHYTHSVSKGKKKGKNERERLIGAAEVLL